MPSIKKMVIKNFKKFESLELEVENDLNILLGDNESGKSSILLALDLVLSASRSKVETLGVESLLRVQAVEKFMVGERSVADLP